ncbi:MAG: zinc ABC transporter substrate-binding protein [Coriobacteriales bacterium]|jgi:zinc transport system substrate-binding protein|nr:zinc ABC transporter substrate-binding protein [Coriobacteriales bacterium]
MKKLVSLVLVATLALFVLAGSGACTAASPAGTGGAEGKISVVTTIFPPYDFTRAVAGDHAEVTMLLPPGAESHSYEPTPQDIIKIQNCDVFIYNGGESDAWVDGILASLDTSNIKVVKFIDCVEVVEEEVVEGMEEEGHDHDEPFTEEDIKDRALTDWAGEWQSVYPYLANGSLDELIEHKAEADEDESKDEAYYRSYYDTAYKTDVDRIVVTADTMTFYTNGVPATAHYKYQGTGVIPEGESFWVRYKFEATDPVNGAPRFVMFSDHLHAPEKSEHFHVYSSDVSFDVLMEDTEPVNWPTYYSSELDSAGILGEMLGHDEEEHAIDEHVWTSPRNAKLIVQRIADALAAVDPDHKAEYASNAAGYQEKLDELDAQFATVASNGARKTIVFGDRFPFRYFADAYGLEYYAAFPGCSTDTEASVATVAFLVDKVKSERIPVVFHIEMGNVKMSEAIAEQTGAKVLLLNACHNVTRDDFASGKTYLDLMGNNVDALREALR